MVVVARKQVDRMVDRMLVLAATVNVQLSPVRSSVPRLNGTST